MFVYSEDSPIGFNWLCSGLAVWQPNPNWELWRWNRDSSVINDLMVTGAYGDLCSVLLLAVLEPLPWTVAVLVAHCHSQLSVEASVGVEGVGEYPSSRWKAEQGRRGWILAGHVCARIFPFPLFSPLSYTPQFCASKMETNVLWPQGCPPPIGYISYSIGSAASAGVGLVRIGLWGFFGGGGLPAFKNGITCLTS